MCDECSIQNHCEIDEKWWQANEIKCKCNDVWFVNNCGWIGAYKDVMNLWLMQLNKLDDKQIVWIGVE